MRCGVESCARQEVETRANPANNAKTAKHLFIDDSIGHRNELENGCPESVNRLTCGVLTGGDTGTRKQLGELLRIGWNRGPLQSCLAIEAGAASRTPLDGRKRDDPGAAVVLESAGGGH